MKQRISPKPRYLAASIAAAIFALDVGTAVAAFQLEEIVVTARKREESLQDVPVVVQALSGDTLEDLNTTTFQDLNDQVSGLTIYTSSVINPSINLRGIQGDSVNAGTDEAVAINFNGIQHSNAQLFRFPMFDIESVEVLKGPQALYFGKNSPGGIVAVTTRDPTEELFSEIQVGYEEAGERLYGHAIVSGPLNDVWGARLGVKLEDSEGIFENTWGKDDPTVEQPDDRFGPNYEQYVAQATLKGDFEKGDVTFKLYNANREGGHYNQVQLFRCNELSLSRNPYTDCRFNDTYSSRPMRSAEGASAYGGDNEYEYEMSQLSIDANYEINDTWSFNNVIGWVDIDNRVFGNIGPHGAGGLALAQPIEIETFSEEFRFSGDFDSFRVMAGAYFDERKTTAGAALFLTETLKTTADSETIVDSDSWSVFTQMDIDLTETLELSLGARYTEESRSFEGRNLEDYNFINRIQYHKGPHSVANPDLDTSNLSPELALSWHPADNVTLFVTYKEGFKSGGYNMSGNSLANTNATLISGGVDTGIVLSPNLINDYDREDVRGYEIGLKLQLLDNTLRINSALFSYDYTELQSSAIFRENGVPVSRTINAGTAFIEGFETDILWQTPIEALTVSANLAFNDNEFGDFVTQCNEVQRYTEGDTGCDVDVDGDLTTNAGGTNSVILNGGFDGQSRKGDPLRRAPEWSGSIGLNWDSELTGGLRFKANLLGSYSDEYQGSNENNPMMVQDAYWIFSGGLGLYAENGAWSVDLIGRNLTDEAVALSIFDLSRSVSGSAPVPQATGATRNNPREVMLQFTFRPELLF